MHAADMHAADFLVFVFRTTCILPLPELCRSSFVHTYDAARFDATREAMHS